MNDLIADSWPAPYAEGRANPWIAQMLLTLPMAFAVIGYDGLIQFTNEAMEATCGDACRKGVPPSAMFAPADVSRIKEMTDRAVAGQGPFELRAAVAARPDEEQVLTLTPVPPGLGVAALLAMRDIREQVRLEQQVAAVTRMQAVGQLAGGIAHDFNNILTAVLGLTDQLLARHRPGDADYDDLDQIGVNGRRAAALVAQLLAFARQQPRRQEVLALEDTVTGLRPLLEQLCGKKISLTIDAPELRQSIRADPSQIEQIIVNLAVNARDAMGGLGTLAIRLSDIAATDVPALGHAIMPAIDYAKIAVADTGTGIAPEIAGKIFEPFFSTKPQGQGTGLGLSTVYGIVKQSGGFIFAEPRVGGGTIFNIYLPAVPRPAKTVPAGAAAAPTPAKEQRIASRLLVVEDEPAVRAVLVRGLRRHGFAVADADGGEAALAHFATGEPVDVLVSDIMMPGIDGVALAARARKLRPGIGIVLMSGFAEPPLRRAAAAQGTRFLAKPFPLADLVAAIAAAAPLE